MHLPGGMALKIFLPVFEPVTPNFGLWMFELLEILNNLQTIIFHTVKASHLIAEVLTNFWAQRCIFIWSEV